MVLTIDFIYLCLPKVIYIKLMIPLKYCVLQTQCSSYVLTIYELFGGTFKQMDAIVHLFYFNPMFMKMELYGHVLGSPFK